MTIRVTVDEVKAIFDTDLGAGSIEAFIKAANRVVEDNLASKSIEDDTLMEIERWLAAHLAAQRDPVALSRKVGDTQENYALAVSNTEKGLGLNNTPYGQQVLLLDHTGTLASIIGRSPAVFEPVLEVDDA